MECKQCLSSHSWYFWSKYYAKLSTFVWSFHTHTFSYADDDLIKSTQLPLFQSPKLHFCETYNIPTTHPSSSPTLRLHTLDPNNLKIHFLHLLQSKQELTNSWCNFCTQHRSKVNASCSKCRSHSDMQLLHDYVFAGSLLNTERGRTNIFDLPVSFIPSSAKELTRPSVRGSLIK